jgi:hypothetical protein
MSGNALRLFMKGIGLAQEGLDMLVDIEVRPLARKPLAFI